jgi:hypothetical protein
MHNFQQLSDFRSFEHLNQYLNVIGYPGTGMSLEEVCSQRSMRHRALDVQFWPYQVASLPSSHSDHSVSLQASSFLFHQTSFWTLSIFINLSEAHQPHQLGLGQIFGTAMGWMIHIKMCGRLGAWLWTLWLIYR